MTTPEKCEAVLKSVLERVNEAGEKSTYPSISFGYDWGGNSLTIVFPDDTHTHVGHYDLSWENLVDNLYGQFIKGKGLSRV